MIINKRMVNQILFAVIVLMFFLVGAISILKLPKSFMYIFDVAFAFALFYCCLICRDRILKTIILFPSLVFIAILLCALTVFIINKYSLYTLGNGIRTNFRIFIVFISIACISDEIMIRNTYHSIYVFFWINVVVCTIQYFGFGIRGDYCNGIFGIEKTNSWTNGLLCIIVAHTISLYLKKCVSLKKALLVCIACLYTATLAEVKFFYFELVFIVVIIILSNRPSLRAATICVISGIILTVMIAIFNSLWGVNGVSVFSVEGIQEYFTEKSYGYASVGDWGRIGGVSKATEKFFSEGINFGGMGVGACGYGTQFQKTYEYLHYIWFAYITVFMEQGWCGLVLYFLFFGSIVFIAQKRKRKIENMYIKSMYDVTECMAVLSIVLMFYNTTIINYPGMLIAVVMALPFNLNKGAGCLDRVQCFFRDRIVLTR